VSNDAALLKVSYLFMTAVLYVVIQAHSRLWNLFCLYRVLKYYSNIEFPPNRPHTKIRQSEVKSHTSQMPSRKACGW
jgi:hypothetical protein